MNMRSLCAGVRLGLLLGCLTAAGPACAADDVAPGAHPTRSVLTREDLARAGFVTVGDVLQRLPWAGQALNPLFNGGGNGEHWLDLRDIGAVRTLVLVDGRHWIGGLDGVADLTAIPLAAVERIEVDRVGDGARAGSGAIAGTVNIVLRAAHDGAQTRAWVGEHDDGDGRTQHYELAIGSRSERADAMLVATYAKQEPVLAADRPIAASLPGLDPDSVLEGASSTTPFGRFDGPGIPGTVVLIPGEDGREPSDFRPYDPARDGYNIAPDNYVLTPSERHALYSRVRYALTDTIDVSTAALYNERRSQTRFAPLPLAFGSLLFGPSAPDGFDVAATNVFNPFGVPIQRVQFRNSIAPRVFDENVDSLHVGVGVGGRGEAFGRPFAWSLHGSYADVEELATATGFLDRERVRLGVGPSFRAADGTPVCGTPAAPIAGCVPINVFGGPAGFTRAMYDYASVVQRSVRGTDQTTFAGTVHADVLALPAGPLRVGAGYTHRRVSGFDAPDSLDDDAAFAGDHDVDEAHVALDAPLVAGAPFAHALDLALAARHVAYRLDAPAIAASDPRAPLAFAGGRDDDVLGSVALRWAPTPALDVHAGYAESSRLPTLRETSSAGALGFTNEIDPCSSSLRGALSSAAQARCLQGFAGLPPVPALYESNSAQHPFATGGNPALRPERGRTTHAALVWRPTGAPADALGVTWQRTRVDERIALADEDELLGRCYVLGDADACRFLRRDPSGQPFAFLGNVNAGRLDVETWDVFAQHAFATPLGAIDARLDVTYLASYDIGIPPGADYLDAITGDTSRAGGLIGNYADGTPLHRVRANLAASWRRGDWAVHLGARYRSGVDEPCNLPPAAAGAGICDSAPSLARPLGEHHAGSTTYVDAQLDWASPWHAIVSAGLRNALDRDAPVAYSIEGHFPRDAEVPGRFVYVSYTQRF